MRVRPGGIGPGVTRFEVPDRGRRTLGGELPRMTVRIGIGLSGRIRVPTRNRSGRTGTAARGGGSGGGGEAAAGPGSERRNGRAQIKFPEVRLVDVIAAAAAAAAAIFFAVGQGVSKPIRE